MHNIPIFLASDDRYAPFVATTIASICSNTLSFCDFYVLDGGISDENKTKICFLKGRYDNFSIEFLPIDLQKEFSSIDYKNSSKYVTLSTYNRFLIPKLKPNLEKVLYLDVDIIVNCDVAELYTQDLDNYALGAVPEKYVTKKNKQRHLSDLKLNSMHKYFNAGILVIDNSAWLKNNILQQAFNVEKEYRDKLALADQDILNIIFNNNYKKLAYQYNFMNENAYFENKDGLLGQVIRHYNGPIKPWLINPNYSEKNKMLKNIQEFWLYAKQTEFFDYLQTQVFDEKTQQSLIIHSRVQSAVLNQYGMEEFVND